MLANFFATVLACVRVLAALSRSEAFQVSAMLDTVMHLVDDSLLWFSDDPLDLVSKGCKRSRRVPPFAAFHTATAACFYPKSGFAAVFSALCIATCCTCNIFTE